MNDTETREYREVGGQLWRLCNEPNGLWVNDWPVTSNDKIGWRVSHVYEHRPMAVGVCFARRIDAERAMHALIDETRGWIDWTAMTPEEITAAIAGHGKRLKRIMIEALAW